MYYERQEVPATFDQLYDAPLELRRVAHPCHIVPLHDYGSGVQYSYNLGVALRSQGRLEPAERAYREAARRNSLQLEARINLGEVRLTLGRYPEAAAAFEDALRLDPDNPGALFGGAVAHARFGDAGRASAPGAALSQVDPDLAERLRATLGMANQRE